MAVVLTCPHCGKMESWRPEEGARTNCRFCGAAVLSDSAIAPEPNAAKPFDWGAIYRELKWGAVWGGLFAAAITLMFRLVPTLPVIDAFLSQEAQEDLELWVQSYTRLMDELTELGISAGAGIVTGSVIMTIAALLLQSRPYRLPSARRGALAGAILGALAVLLALTLPLFIDSAAAGRGNALAWHWFACQIAAALGATAGSSIWVWYDTVTDDVP